MDKNKEKVKKILRNFALTVLLLCLTAILFIGKETAEDNTAYRLQGIESETVSLEEISSIISSYLFNK